MLRRCVNIGVLFSALVLTPLLALSHFSAGLAGLLADFADDYLPNPTVLSAERKSKARYVEQVQAERVARAKKVSAQRQRTAQQRAAALAKGRRVLLRGGGALAVGWVPVVGVTADLYSLSEDFGDVCDLLQIIDGMSGALFSEEQSLYRINYCHTPEEALEAIKAEASDVQWPWLFEQIP